MMNIHFYLVVTWGEVVTHDILFYIDINIYLYYIYRKHACI